MAEGVDLVLQELKSKGVVAVTVADGKLFMFSRATVEELYRQLQERPDAEQLYLMVYSDPEKMKAAQLGQKKALA